MSQMNGTKVLSLNCDRLTVCRISVDEFVVSTLVFKKQGVKS